jgi:hypothetical protein
MRIVSKRILFALVSLVLLIGALMPSFVNAETTVELLDVTLNIYSPQNRTYTSNSVMLNFSWSKFVNENSSVPRHIGYYIDDELHLGIGYTNVSSSYTTLWTNLADGKHKLTICVSGMGIPLGQTTSIDFTVDTTDAYSNQYTEPFNVQLDSPRHNKVYKTNDVLLNFSWNRAPDGHPWHVGYYIDNELHLNIGWTNVSGSHTTVWQDLSEGSHRLAIYISGGIMPNQIIEITFYVDTSLPPEVTLSSPKNTTYQTDPQLQFTVDKPASWMGYSLDGQNNVTTTEKALTLTGLANGLHNIIVYANDTKANMATSEKIEFTVNNPPPTIIVLAPENKTYNTKQVQLNFTVNEQPSKMLYCLDGQNNVTITENAINLTGLPDGTHTITIYATDQNGNTGTSTINFTINTTNPTLIITTALIVATAIAVTIIIFKHKKPPKTDKLKQ